MSDEDFNGFPKQGLDFLRELGTRDKKWFDANRSTYQETVVKPSKSFVTSIGQGLARSFAPEIVFEPKANGSIAPINNDLRFSPDKPPYKDHLLLKFWEGDNKKTAATLYVRLSPDHVGFATGAMLPDLDRWRDLIDNDVSGQAMAKALATLGKGRELDIAGEGYKRVPKPYPTDHPRDALLRHKMIQARWSEPLPDSVGTPDFVEHCLNRLEAGAEVHRWLVANL